METNLTFTATVTTGGGGEDRVSLTIRGTASGLTLIQADFSFEQWGRFVARPGLLTLPGTVNTNPAVLGKLETWQMIVGVPRDLQYSAPKEKIRQFLVGELRNRELDAAGWVADVSDVTNSHRGPAESRTITLRRYVDEAGKPI